MEPQTQLPASSSPGVSPFSSQLSSTGDFDSFVSTLQPATFRSLFNPPSDHSLAFKPSCNPNIFLADLSPSTDDVTCLPTDFVFSPDHSVTPLGKNFDLSDDWVVSESYISPVIRASHTQFRRLSSPPMSFMDRLQVQQLSFPLGAVPNARSPPLLLSPLRLASSKENIPGAQHRFRLPVHDYSLLTLPSPTSSSESVSGRGNARTEFKPLLSKRLITPQRLANTPLLLSPLTPLTPSPHKSESLVSNPVPPNPPDSVAKLKKRRLSVSESPTFRAKRARHNLYEADRSSTNTPVTVCSLPLAESPPCRPPIFGTRVFPSTNFLMSPDFPLFYRRFPASSYFEVAGSGFVLKHLGVDCTDKSSSSPYVLFNMQPPGVHVQYKAPRDAFDLYSPRFVKGKGADKVGLCPVCVESPHRGGEGKKVWLSLKFSAFKCYHMQYYHGISASTGRPLSPPIDFRVVARPDPKKIERAEVQQGKCHKCLQWVIIQTIKNVEVKARVPELFWWKHAVACHFGAVLEGERGAFEEDEVYRVLKEMTEVP
ncbi:hypothetical protein GGX14DRAFT_629086 [Mycena pura]|uniref:Transcription regulator Rua1 C-terminal domain-containing protein n=1 Tax=Mycena pura TaxID=153505 RepID=A0AAD6YRT1_9AGAR|nr:hypothetical protein GGX14DRAFT_629086 [Mycena pura]